MLLLLLIGLDANRESQERMPLIPTSRSWQQTPFGVVAISAGIFLCFAVIGLALLIGKYWWQIKSGEGVSLGQRFETNFSRGEIPPTAAGVAISRAELERPEAPFAGASKAAITIVEFIDFKCPNCRTAVPIMRQVLAKYGSKVKLIIRHFPVESTHPGATRFAEIGYCAHQQGKFWNVYEWLYAMQDILPAALAPADRAALATATGLDSSALEACLANPSTVVAINRDYADALRSGVRGTPTFFVNGEKAEGAIPFKVWENYIKKFR